MAEKELPPANILTTAQMHTAMGIDRKMLSNVRDAGYVKPIGENQWDERATFLGYVKFQRDRRNAKSEAETRLRDEKLIGEKLKNAEKMGLVVPVDDLDDFGDATAGIWLTELGALPARHHKRDLQERRRLEREINEIFGRVSDYFKRVAETFPTTKRIISAFDRGNAGRRGGKQPKASGGDGNPGSP